jgi:anti-sigma-K factor RskA
MTPNETPQGYDELEASLPWYVNGTLDAETRNRIAAALLTDARLRKALEMVQDEAEAAGGINESIPAPSPRVLDNIVSRLPPISRANRAFVRWYVAERLTEFMAALRPRTLVYATLTAVLILTIQTGVIGMLALQNQGPGPELASVPGNGISTQNLKLIVKFAPRAEFSKVSDLLEELDAEIVEGPSGGGLFTIGLELPQDGEAGIEKLIQEIRSKTELVEFVSRSGS